MNVISQKLCLVLVAFAVVATGCTKQPQRPDPSATMGMGGAGAGLSPSDINTMDPLLLDGSASGLQLRDGVIEDAHTIRGLLESVYFDFDQSAIRADQRAKLAAAQEYLQQNPQHRLLLEGHCDWRGTAEYNLGLGERRANAAQQYLITLGVSTNRIQTSSKGDLEAVENATESQMALDRRVEVVVLKQ